MSNFIKMTGSVLTGSESGIGSYSLGATEFRLLDALSATAAEINYLDNDDLTAADITKLAALTATAAEINYLDNDDLSAADLQKLADITATAAEINDLTSNAVDGSDFTKLSNITATAAELNLLDDAVAGSVVNSKAVVYSGAGQVNASALSASGDLSASQLDIDGAADVRGKFTAVGVSDLDGGIDVNASKFTVSTAGAVVADSSISGAAGSFDAITGVSLDVQSGGISNAGAIAGATTIDASGDLTVGSITMAEFAVDGSGNTDVDGTLNVEGVPTFQAQSVHSAGATFNSAGLAACGAIAGASTIDGSGALTMGTITMTGFTVDADGDTAVKSLDVNSAASIDNAGAVSAASYSATGFGAFGGGYSSGGSGATISASGAIQANGAVLLDSTLAVTGTVTAKGNMVIGSSAANTFACASQLTASNGLSVEGSSGPGGYALNVAEGAGGVRADEFVTYSDRSLKTNIQLLDGALDKVMMLEPTTYEKVSTGKNEIGFIAQDVAKVVPEICAIDASGEGRGIDYSRMSTLLVGALKAQQDQIAQLKEIVAKLQK